MKKFCLLIFCFATIVLSAVPIIKSGEKISFLGDSITGLGTYHEIGYVNLVIDGLKNAGVTAVRMPAGKGGDKSPMMLARLQRDALAYKPQFMTLSCGVNDVWHSRNNTGVELPEYEKSMREIVTTAKAAGVKVLLLTPTMIYEDPANKFNTKLAAYNAFLKKLAAEEGCILVDTNRAMQNELIRLKKLYPEIKGNLITIDGVHMNPLGDVVMAKEILRGFGLSESEIESAAAGWENRTFYSGMAKIRYKDFKKLVALANENKISIADAVDIVLRKALEE